MGRAGDLLRDADDGAGWAGGSAVARRDRWRERRGAAYVPAPGLEGWWATLAEGGSALVAGAALRSAVSAGVVVAIAVAYAFLG